MDVRYQVFVSSTFEDLKKERAAAVKAILGLGAIPVGMEMFPAGDDETMVYIKKQISESDYYVVVLGGRYGSLDSETDKSYTELEYEHALDEKVPVLAFLNSNVDNSLAEKPEQLEAFYSRVKNDRVVQFWKTSEELKQNVSSSLSSAFRLGDRPGWVRQESSSSVKESIESLEGVTTRLFESLAYVEGKPSLPGLDKTPWWNELSVHLFVVDGRQGIEKLTPLACSTHHSRDRSGIDWVKGKGAVGVAWDSAEVCVHCEDDRYLDLLDSKEGWSKLSSKRRRGFERDEAAEIARKSYDAITAVPVKSSDGRDVIGVVSIDSEGKYFEFHNSQDLEVRIRLWFKAVKRDLETVKSSYDE